MNRDAETRARIEDHWAASERGDTGAEHEIYAADAVLDYPQSGERFRGRAKIQAQRGGHPADRHFAVRRISGRENLWISECVITYDGEPAHSVSIHFQPMPVVPVPGSSRQQPVQPMVFRHLISHQLGPD
jgi:hypothetical protein